MIKNSVASLTFLGQICNFWIFSIFKKGINGRCVFHLFYQFNFCVNLENLKLILSDIQTLADICIMFLDTG